MRRAPLLLALVAGALLASLPALAPSSAEAAPTLAQVGTFARPVYVMAPPRDTRDVYVVERGGTVRLLVDGVRRGTPFLDIRNLVQTSDSKEDERGLLSIAFAPDYAQSGRFYAYYTSKKPPAARPGDVVIDEFHRSAANPEVADPATRRTLVAIDHDDFQNHNGGQLAFGPDGMLWAGTGDGGGGGDPLGSGQNVGSMLGKILRLDVRPGAALAPADNPFGPAGPEAWAIGFRNPFRFSFDRLTGDLAIGDVGQEDIEEIDFVTRAAGLGRGGNFGWNILEGSNRYGAGRPARPDELPANYVAPVIEHTHSSGWCSIIGGYVVRDTALPDLYGRYVYGDYCRGEIWSAALGPSGAAGDASTGLHVSGLSSLGEDGCGRVYATSIDGPVYRLATTGVCAGPAPVPFPAIDGPVGTPGAGRAAEGQAPGRAAPEGPAHGLRAARPALRQDLPRHGHGQPPAGQGQRAEAAARAEDARRERPSLAQGAHPPAGAPPAAGPARRAPAGAGPHDGDRDRRHGQAARRADPGDPRAMTAAPGEPPGRRVDVGAGL